MSTSKLQRYLDQLGVPEDQCCYQDLLGNGELLLVGRTEGAGDGDAHRPTFVALLDAKAGTIHRSALGGCQDIFQRVLAWNNMLQDDRENLALFYVCEVLHGFAPQRGANEGGEEVEIAHPASDFYGARLAAAQLEHPSARTVPSAGSVKVTLTVRRRSVCHDMSSIDMSSNAVLPSRRTSRKPGSGPAGAQQQYAIFFDKLEYTFRTPESDATAASSRVDGSSTGAEQEFLRCDILSTVSSEMLGPLPDSSSLLRTTRLEVLGNGATRAPKQCGQVHTFTVRSVDSGPAIWNRRDGLLFGIHATLTSSSPDRLSSGEHGGGSKGTFVVAVDAEDQGNGVFVCSYEVFRAGAFNLRVTLGSAVSKRVQIQGSPVGPIQFTPGPICPERSYVTGSGASCGQIVNPGDSTLNMFTVVVRDKCGNERDLDDSASLRVRLELQALRPVSFEEPHVSSLSLSESSLVGGSSAGDPLFVQLQPIPSGTEQPFSGRYECRYLLSKAGTYSCHVEAHRMPDLLVDAMSERKHVHSDCWRFQTKAGSGPEAGFDEDDDFLFEDFPAAVRPIAGHGQAADACPKPSTSAASPRTLSPSRRKGRSAIRPLSPSPRHRASSASSVQRPVINAETCAESVQAFSAQVPNSQISSCPSWDVVGPDSFLEIALCFQPPAHFHEVGGAAVARKGRQRPPAITVPGGSVLKTGSTAGAVSPSMSMSAASTLPYERSAVVVQRQKLRVAIHSIGETGGSLHLRGPADTQVACVKSSNGLLLVERIKMSATRTSLLEALRSSGAMWSAIGASPYTLTVVPSSAVPASSSVAPSSIFSETLIAGRGYEFMLIAKDGHFNSTVRQAASLKHRGRLISAVSGEHLFDVDVQQTRSMFSFQLWIAEADLYRLELFACQHGTTSTAHGFPREFRVVADEHALSPEKCTLSGVGWHTATAGLSSSFTINAADSCGNWFTGGGHADAFTASWVEPGSEAGVELHADDLGDGSYAVNFWPSRSGRGLLKVYCVMAYRKTSSANTGGGEDYADAHAMYLDQQARNGIHGLDNEDNGKLFEITVEEVNVSQGTVCSAACSMDFSLPGSRPLRCVAGETFRFTINPRDCEGNGIPLRLLQSLGAPRLDFLAEVFPPLDDDHQGQRAVERHSCALACNGTSVVEAVRVPAELVPSFRGVRGAAEMESRGCFTVDVISLTVAGRYNFEAFLDEEGESIAPGAATVTVVPGKAFGPSSLVIGGSPLPSFLKAGALSMTEAARFSFEIQLYDQCNNAFDGHGALLLELILDASSEPPDTYSGSSGHRVCGQTILPSHFEVTDGRMCVHSSLPRIRAVPLRAGTDWRGHKGNPAPGSPAAMTQSMTFDERLWPHLHVILNGVATTGSPFAFCGVIGHRH